MNVLKIPKGYQNGFHNEALHEWIFCTCNNKCFFEITGLLNIHVMELKMEIESLNNLWALLKQQVSFQLVDILELKSKNKHNIICLTLKKASKLQAVSKYSLPHLFSGGEIILKTE